LLAGDKRLNVRYLGEWQEDDNEGYTAGFDEDTMRVTTSPPEPDVIDEGTGNLRFGSSHAGTINALFADGSVRSISYEIDASVFAALGNISDGQPNNADGF
jgi:prepilin-type processing-associated H-X9-DG protein